MNGEGKYDEETTAIRNHTKAKAVLLAVFDGDRGTGFSVQATEDVLLGLPAILMHIAAEISKDLKTLVAEPEKSDQETEDDS